MTLPLDGIRVLVTRAHESTGPAAAMLREQGATVDEVPIIRIGPPPNERVLSSAVAGAEHFDWIIFTSANGVRAFAQRRDVPLGSPPLGSPPRIAAVGPATAVEVERRLYRRADLLPTEAYVAESLADALIGTASLPARALILQAEDARPVLASRLRSAGFDVVSVAAYSTIEAPPPDLSARVREVDVIVLASASAARSLSNGLRLDRDPGILRGKLVACIGPVTLAEAHRFGMQVEIVPPEATMRAVVDALCDYYSGTGSFGRSL